MLRKTTDAMLKVLVARRWWLLGPAALGILGLEIYEYLRPKSFFYHLVEFFLYVVILIVVGLLVDLLVRSMNRQSSTLQILDFQHRLDVELMQHDDWKEVTTKLTSFLAGIAPIDEAGLFIYSPFNGNYAIASHWVADQKVEPVLLTQEPAMGCPIMPGEDEFLSSLSLPGPCNECPDPLTRQYCLPISYAGHPLALYRFTLQPGASLSDDQKTIFANLRHGIAIALRAAQDRRTLAEMRTAETSLTERRKISQFLHDHLGQDLAFLRLKLDQLIAERDRLTPQIMHADLKRLRDVACEANETVRGILQSVRPETTPVLTNVLREYTRKVSQRADLEIRFDETGKPVIVSSEAGQAVFFAFQEALLNVEKHSAATQVTVQVKWTADSLAVEIADNGKGFNPDRVDRSEHFGLEIMQERIARVAGQVDLTSSAKSGTTVTISVPLLQHENQLVKVM